jgi:beta-lactamase superfamily II metal-dependent hydrolase
MLVVEALDAGHGDALLVRWGPSSEPRTALIDGGPGSVWRRRVRPRLMALDAGDIPHLSWVVVSHVDDDHIGGVLRLMYELHDARQKQENPPYRVDRFWHNSLDDLATGGTVPPPPFAAAINRSLAAGHGPSALRQSVNQGREARDLASFLGLVGNPPVGSTLTCGQHVDIDGLSVTVVGPRASELQKQWDRWRAAVNGNDVRAAAAAFTDPNVFNHASIVLLLEYDGARVLLTGDARGDHLLEGLRELGILASPDDHLHVDVFKVPHHGSAHNSAPALFAAISADHYVISASGRHGHPDRSVLDWIIASRAGDRYGLHFTNAVVQPYDVLAYVHGHDGIARADIDVRQPNRSGVEITLRP